MKFKLILFVLLLVVVMVFVYQNSATVMLQFVKWQYPVPLALMLFSVLAAGILLGMGMVLRRQSYNKKKKALKESTRQQPQESMATSAPLDDQGPEHQEGPAESPEATVNQLTGEHHESNNSDYRGDSRFR